MKRVLIISYNFQQKETIGSIRLRALAKYLHSFGWETTILSGTAGKDEGFMVTEVVIDDVLSKWKKKLRLDLEKPLKAQFTPITKCKRKPSILDYLVNLWEELIAYPDDTRTWIKPAIAKGRDLLNNQRFDAIISSSRPVSTHLVAVHLASEFKLPWVADFRDLWTQNHYRCHTFIRNFLEQRLECNTLSTANALTTVSIPLKDKLQSLHKNKKVTSILNGFDPDQINLGFPLTKKMSIVYTGILYQSRRDPEPFFHTLKILIDEKIIDPTFIEVNFFGCDDEWLLADIKKFQLQNIVTVNGKISRQQSIQKQREAHILLLLTWNDPAEKGVYTGKLFDYLAACRPILSMGYTDGGVVKELLNQTQSGVHISNELELKNYLIEVYNEYKKDGTVHYRGIGTEINKFSHIEMAREFAKVLDEITN